jgi:hypothetical protein
MMDNLSDNSKAVIPITEEELNILEERWEKYLNDSTNVKTWEEVKESIQKKLQR